MYKYLKKCLVIFGLLALAYHQMPAIAYSDEEHGRFSIGGRGSYFDPRDGDGSWMGGIQTRLRVLGPFGIEASADYRKTSIGDDTKAKTTIHTYPVQLSGMIQLFHDARLSPYILGGGGWYYTTVEGPGGFDQTQNRFGWHLGGGLEFYLTDHVSIDGSYRYVWIESLDSVNQLLSAQTYKDSGHMITGALNYHF